MESVLESAAFENEKLQNHDQLTNAVRQITLETVTSQQFQFVKLTIG